jgi:MSHA biogenesis protein MshQ
MHSSVLRVLGQWLGLCLLLMLSGAAWSIGTVTVVSSGQAGFATPTYTSTYLKTVDFATKTLANSAGVSQGTSTLSGGTWGTTSSSVPTGFTGTYAKLASKSGSKTSAYTTINFTNGTDYVSFLWFLANGDSDNTVTYNLSDGSSQSISNCGTVVDTCVGGYDEFNIFTALFGWLFGSTGNSTSLRMTYVPPEGAVVNSITLKATSTLKCVLIVLCSYESRSMAIDSLSYNDDTSGDLNPNGIMDHLEIYADTSQNVTCANTTMRVRACANAACSRPYVGGATGTIKLTNGATVKSAAFTIPLGDAYSGDVSLAANATGTWVASATSGATGTNTCAIGALAVSSNCNLTVNASGLVLSLASHYAGTSQPLGVQVALAGVCSPVLSVAGNLVMNTSATYNSSASPSLTDSAGTVRSLTTGSVVSGVTVAVTNRGLGSNTFKFNAGGVAKVSMSIASVSLGGLSGLVGFSGNVVTRVVPKKVRLVPALGGVDMSAIDANKISAGSTFQLKIEGEDIAGNLVPLDPDLTALGTVALTKTVIKPVAAALNNDPDLAIGTLTLVSGVPSMNVSWAEVGTLGLTSGGITNYMGSGLDVAAGVVGGFNLRFVPASFRLDAAPPCSDGTNAFVYAGQPFPISVTALNAANAVTQNYDGTATLPADRVARDVTISATSGLANGTLGGSTVAATLFDGGIASGSVTDTLAPAKKQSAPEPLKLKAIDGDVVTNASVPSVLVRSGRIKLSNAYGSEAGTLRVPMQVQYWDGEAWVPAGDTTCATQANLLTGLTNNKWGNALGNQKTHAGTALTSLTLPVVVQSVNLGSGTASDGFLLNAPGKGKTGTVDVTLDLSASGANMPWLQSLDESCGHNVLCNPKARASFGVYKPEGKVNGPKTVTIRNVY